MSLHVETLGRGAPLILLHGWGMHGGIWGSVVDRLAQDFELHVVDLPGHGASAPLDLFTLDAVVDLLAGEFEQAVDVMGWSLGGILAQYWVMREPQKIRRLVLAASTPCFTNREDWNGGMPPDMLAKFVLGVETDFETTIRRFVMLQMRGGDSERELLSMLREKLFNRGKPDMVALRGGLDILRDADLRHALPQIKQPVLVIAGGRDKITPAAASQHMAQVVPNAQLIEIVGAAHAPFLSHPEIFAEHTKRFLNGTV